MPVLFHKIAFPLEYLWGFSLFSFPFRCQSHNGTLDMCRKTNSGGYSAGVPPLPIPNREVKPGRADGTAPQCGRVGRRRPHVQGPFLKVRALHFFLCHALRLSGLTALRPLRYWAMNPLTPHPSPLTSNLYPLTSNLYPLTSRL